nr:MAG TPA_asm: hypothetical protein [Bacteriophage sp.]
MAAAGTRIVCCLYGGGPLIFYVSLYEISAKSRK